ncbi:Forkhead box protein B1 [Orchesella cincta]|uniref:Forkhead box protein B1 n=1 Tax=Orchesella cincta TaxID=48709 RepID=A0A1D2N7I9_ORCCI|nr:Forkhead box protein B1 [Orchesella cincta]
MEINPIPVRNPFPPVTSVSGSGQITPIPPPPTVSSGNMNVGQNPVGIPSQIPGGGLLSPVTASALEHYRLTQLYQYAMAAERLRVPPGSFLPQMPPGLRPELAPLFYGPYCRIDPRLAGLCRPPEEPKPQFSYIGLIAMAILSSPDKKLVLSDIYQYILDNYPYFRTRGPGWRNSIRHNLSLNDCFIKAGRSANGKGHYWAIHPANVDDFTKGDFRRRKAQRKVRRHMGLAVDDDDSPSPPPASPPPAWHHPHHAIFHPGGPHPIGNPMALAGSPQNPGLDLPATLFGLSAAAAASLSGKSPQDPSFHHHHHHPMSSSLFNRKRQFDVASLLAPEKESGGAISPNSYKSDEHDRDQSLSSPSPPPGSEGTLKRSKIFKGSRNFGPGNDSSDDESIEVTEDDGLGKQHFSRKCQGGGDNETDEVVQTQMNDSDNKINHSRDGSDCSRGASPQPQINSTSILLSPREKNVKMSKLGQCGTSSNDEDDGGCKTHNYCSNIGKWGMNQQHNIMMLRNDKVALNNSNGSSAENDGVSSTGMLRGQSNMQLPTMQQMLNQQNLMNHASNAAAGGGLPPLEILQAHHHLVQQQQQQQSQNSHQVGSGQGPPMGFPFGIPGGHQFLQQNPSLASLMLLSSKYRELTMSAGVMKRPQP